jgi:hypothetical protein
LGIPATSVRPRFRPTLRSFALNLPNAVVNAGTIAMAWGAGAYSVLIVLVAVRSFLSSMVNCLLGGPELVITPSPAPQAH